MSFMTIAENITDAISFARSLGDVCLVVAIIGCIFMLMASACVLSFPNEHPDGSIAEPPVTVLKPLHEAEPGLPSRLVGVLPAELWRSHSGPVRRAKSQFAGGRRRALDQCQFAGCDRRARGRPAHPWRQSQSSNLINICRARGTTRWCSPTAISWSGRTICARSRRCLPRRSVGAVTCLYHGIGGEGVWARLSALAINSQFLPQAITAVSLGLAQPCCGATIALRRSVLDRIGGFSALADTLADDHAIGVAVRAEGYEVVTAPFLVGHRCFETSLHQLVRQQIRVARTIKSIDPLAYACTM